LDVKAHLRPAGMREDSAVLEDEQRLDDARGLLAALLPRRPAQRLQLHLPVDARKLAALLQHRLGEEQSPELAACHERWSVVSDRTKQTWL